ncbi:MAG: hypothetical protein JWO67_3153 [Streptosporangiaceae bacterium]|nr:hypothetical protein [Streptosporangiaceae bacterium]
MHPVAARQAASMAAVPHHFTAISLAAAGACLVFALMQNWKPIGKIEFLKPWLYLIAGIGIAAAFFTAWAHTIMRWVVATVPVVGSAIPFVIAFVLAYIVIYDLWPKHPTNRTTEYSALLLPAFGPEIGGVVGTWLTTFLSWVAVAGATILGKLFGV